MHFLKFLGLGAAIGCFLLVPSIGHSQTPADVQQLQGVLDTVYDQMMPLVDQILSIAMAIGSFGALFYIGNKVWKHISNAEAIDFYPLFRPFALALLIGSFHQVINLINGILKPTVTATAGIVKGSNDAVQALLLAREDAIKGTTEYKVLVGPTGSGDREGWYQYTHPGATGGEGFFESIGNDLKFAMAKFLYSMKNLFKYFISLLLELIYYAAALCIDTIRIFHLIVLAIIGPFVFALACYDGFQQSLTQWLARYINIYFWLPVANLFAAIMAKIQQNMLKLDLAQIQSTGTTTFTSTDAAYIIFLIIGIIGYTTVPGVANYIVHAHTVNPILTKVNSYTSSFSRNTFSGGNNSQNSEMFNDSKIVIDPSHGDRTGGNNYHHSKISG